MNKDDSGIFLIIAVLWLITSGLLFMSLVLGYGFPLWGAVKLSLGISGIIWVYRCLGSGRWPWDV